MEKIVRMQLVQIRAVVMEVATSKQEFANVTFIITQPQIVPSNQFPALTIVLDMEHVFQQQEYAVANQVIKE